LANKDRDTNEVELRVDLEISGGEEDHAEGDKHSKDEFKPMNFLAVVGDSDQHCRHELAGTEHDFCRIIDVLKRDIARSGAH
jgi:hypothetical protein